MATKENLAGDESKQVAEKMKQLRKTYLEKITRVTGELAETRRQYETECMRLLRGGIRDQGVSLEATIRG